LDYNFIIETSKFNIYNIEISSDGFNLTLEGNFKRYKGYYLAIEDDFPLIADF
jgi:hypothetical protein